MRKRWPIIVIAAIIAAGALFSRLAAWSADRQMRDALLLQARLVAQAVIIEQVKTLNGSDVDLASPDYLRLKEQLALIRLVNPKCRFLYLAGRRNDGSIFFFVDSEPANSKDYSPPGQIYNEAAEEFRRSFDTGRAIVVGPTTDRWGKWVSALVPITNPSTGAVLAVLGMDIEVGDWQYDLAIRAAMRFILVASVLLFAFLFFKAHRDNRKIQNRDAALRKSESQYQQLFQSMAQGVVYQSADGQIVNANPAAGKILGLSLAQMQGKTSLEPNWLSVHENGTPFPGHEHPSMQSLRTGQPVTGCVMGVFHPQLQETRWILIDAVPEFLAGETKPYRVYTTFTDITERKRAEAEREKLQAQLIQAQKMESIGRLAGGVAHDFNNLLTGINGYTELLLSGLSEGDPMYADLMEIKGAANRAAVLTSQLLAFSRKQLIAPKVIDLNNLLAGATNLLKRLIGEDVEWAFHPGEKLGLIKVDPHQIEQMLINLAVNARDAMPEGGKLTITTSNIRIDDEFIQRNPGATPGSYVVLAVSDNGCGIAPEVKEHLFEPFYTTKEKGKGTGLGLSMVYGIVKQNGGFIEVQSEVGAGSTFRIYLPQVFGKAEAVGKLKPDGLPTGTEAILLVEDEDMMRHLARKLLERQGYRVFAVEHSEKAISMIKDPDFTFDLLLTDIVMPNLSGRQLYEGMRALRPDLRVLYISGYTEDSLAPQGVLNEGTNFIKKPFSIESLAHKVREVLDNKPEKD